MTATCYTLVQDKEPKGIIPLENVKVTDLGPKAPRANCFEISSANSEFIKACKTNSEGKVVEGLFLTRDDNTYDRRNSHL